MPLQTINPATGELLRDYPEMELPEVLSILDKVQEDYLLWRERPVAKRAALFQRLAELLRTEKEALGAVMTREMGKPISDAIGEVEKSAWVCEYYAEKGPGFLKDEPIETEASESFVTFQPMGIVLAVMPWNFPFWQVFRAAAPALVAGNAMVLKHASNVPECALTIEALFHRAGFPLNVFRSLMVTSAHASIAVAHPYVHGVTLTGSEEAGKKIAAQAGTQIKKTVLELGGADAYLVLADADIAAAAKCCVASRMINGGQSCIAAKRFIVVEAVRDEFEKAVVEAMRAYVMGDPTKKETKLGPQAREDLRDELHGQVQRCVAEGATLLLGGAVPEKPGAWYPATVLTDVKPGMPAYSDELFGPVASIIPVRDEHEGVKVANDTRFGLGGAVFTRDVAKGRKLAREQLHAGAIAVNDFVRSDPRLPFGGIRMSGYGRELSSFGIREFVNIKTVVVK